MGRNFESSAAKAAVSRIADEESLVFGGMEPARPEAVRGRHEEEGETVPKAPKEKGHRISFVASDEEYFELFRIVKNPRSPYKTVSDFLRQAANDRLRKDRMYEQA